MPYLIHKTRLSPAGSRVEIVREDWTQVVLLDNGKEIHSTCKSNLSEVEPIKEETIIIKDEWKLF